jgi:hypothetical protein
MQLSAAGIDWRAAYLNGDYIRAATISGSGIAAQISDYPDAALTGIWVGHKLVVVDSLAGAKAVLAQANLEANPPPPPGPVKFTGRGGNRIQPQVSLDAGYRAQKFIVEYLASGTKRAADIWRAGTERGFSYITLKRAKKACGVITEPVLAPGKKTVDHWTWRLGPTVNFEPKQHSPSQLQSTPPKAESRTEGGDQSKERGRGGDSSNSSSAVKGFNRPLHYKKIGSDLAGRGLGFQEIRLYTRRVHPGSGC